MFGFFFSFFFIICDLRIYLLAADIQVICSVNKTPGSSALISAAFLVLFWHVVFLHKVILSPRRFKEAVEQREERKVEIKKRKSIATHGYLFEVFLPPGSPTRNRLSKYQTDIAFLYAMASALCELI